jgi:predicted MFS family arabinose efflux permease
MTPLPGTIITGRSRLATFTGLLMTAMGVATFTVSVIGILSSYLIDDLGISRGTLGTVIAATAVGSAVTSPTVGRFTDHLGGRRSLVMIFVLSGAAFIVFAVSPVLWVMYAGALTAAVAQAAGNPSTNKLIALHLPPGRRGIVTGLKQSGVQAAIFLGGVLAPLGAEVVGWRMTLALVALVPALAIPVALWTIPADAPSPRVTDAGRRPPLPASVTWLLVYGTLMGFSGAVTFFLPLYAEEALGLDPRVGGLAVAVVGLTAFAGRIGWARHAERRHRFAESLSEIAAVSVVASAVVFGADLLDARPLLWIGAVLIGGSSSAWNAVGMLAIVDEAGPVAAGRASGVVMFGFLTGLGIGPPLFGYTVDLTGSYASMWWLSIVTAAAALAVAVRWRMSLAGERTLP